MVWQKKKTSHFLTWTNIIITKHKHISIRVFSLGKHIAFNLILERYCLPDEQITCKYWVEIFGIWMI